MSSRSSDVPCAAAAVGIPQAAVAAVGIPQNDPDCVSVEAAVSSGAAAGVAESYFVAEGPLAFCCAICQCDEKRRKEFVGIRVVKLGAFVAGAKSDFLSLPHFREARSFEKLNGITVIGIAAMLSVMKWTKIFGNLWLRLQNKGRPQQRRSNLQNKKK
jgi:hypothetical protein